MNKRMNDSSESIEAMPDAQDAPDADAAAQRWIESRQLECEHGAEGQMAAVGRSAELIENWESSSPLVREKLLDRVGREFMNVHEVPPPRILVKEMPEEQRGSFSDGDFAIRLNEHLLDNPDPSAALKTYLHEYRHAEQAYEVQKSHGPLSHSVDLSRAAALEANDADYIEPDVDYDGYRQQLIEADARHFGSALADEIVGHRDRHRDGGRNEADLGDDGDSMADERLTLGRKFQK